LDNLSKWPDRAGSILDSPTRYGPGGGGAVVGRDGEAVVETKLDRNAGNSGPYGIGRHLARIKRININKETVSRIGPQADKIGIKRTVSASDLLYPRHIEEKKALAERYGTAAGSTSYKCKIFPDFLAWAAKRCFCGLNGVSCTFSSVSCRAR
jgi:hypothetical protein